jgi:Protein of unknown function (DUF3017)
MSVRRVIQAARRQLAFVVVCCVALLGFLQVAVFSEHWLRGVLVIAGGFGLGGLLRLCLSDHRAGMLAVRARRFDVVCYLGFSVLVILFGVLLPR